MKIESKAVVVNAPREEVFDYITNLDNFQHLLPEDRISNWEGRQDYCKFQVKGTATIDLQLHEAKRNENVVLKSGESSPFPFELHVFLSDDPRGTKVYQVCEAQVNPFLKMMVEKPLSNLFDYIADRLVEVKSKS